MRNEKITIYELIGLIKDRKMPKNVIYQEKIYQYDDELYDYSNSIGDMCLLEFIFSSCNNWLYEEVEILPEENDEWEDIEEIDIKNEGNGDFIINEYGTKCGLTKHSKIIAEKVNKLIKNQKYLKERLDKNEI